MTDPARTIICVECGGTAHLITFLPEDEEMEAGTVLAYRCEECAERLDLVWEDVE